MLHIHTYVSTYIQSGLIRNILNTLNGNRSWVITSKCGKCGTGDKATSMDTDN